MEKQLATEDKFIEKPLTNELVGKLEVKPEEGPQLKSDMLKSSTVINPTGNRFTISLPGCGYNVVSVVTANGYIYAGSNGYVYKIDTNGAIVATNNLSGLGYHEIRLAINGSRLVVGTNGYVVLLSLDDLLIYKEVSLPGCGYDVVSVLVGYGYKLIGIKVA
jgi:hypothetical protein